MNNVYKPHLVEFRKRMPEILSPIHSYKKDGDAFWTIGRKTTNKKAHIRAINNGWMRNNKPAQRHFRNVAANLKVANRANATQHIIYLDSDTKGTGSAIDVNRLNAFLTENYFPQLRQPIINERGGGNFLLIDVVEKMDNLRVNRLCTPEQWNETIERLSNCLVLLADKLGCQFSEVAAYGTLPIITYSQYFRGEIADFKTNTKFLFKCPTEEILPVSITYTKLNEVIVSMENYLNMSVEIDEDVEDNLEVPENVEVDETFTELTPDVKVKVLVQKVKSSKGTGSTREHYEGQIRHIEHEIMHMPKPAFIKSGKHKRYITNRMFAEYIHAIVIARQCTDGSMPHWSIVRLIQALKGSGIYTSYGDPTVLTVVRNWMSEHGLIDWIDVSYTKGQAAKWKVNELFRKDVRDEYSLSSVISRGYTGQPLKPVPLGGKPLPADYMEVVDREMQTIEWETEGF